MSVMFTEADLALVALAHATLANVVAEKRANREFLPPQLDAKVASIGALANKMRDANVSLQTAWDHVVDVRHAANIGGSRMTEVLRSSEQSLGECRIRCAELEGRLQFAGQRAPYDPEPDAMLDWIASAPWPDVRYAIAPAQREEYGSLRDAIRHAQRSAHAG